MPPKHSQRSGQPEPEPDTPDLFPNDATRAANYAFARLTEYMLYVAEFPVAYLRQALATAQPNPAVDPDEANDAIDTVLRTLDVVERFQKDFAHLKPYLDRLVERANRLQENKRKPE